MRTAACTIFCLALSLLVGACKEDKAKSLTGIYQTTFESGFVSSDNNGCKPPLKMMDGICAEPYTATNTLGVFEKENGDLDFAANLSFFNGHSCTVSGAAKKDTDGWIFEGEEIADSKCKLLIKSNGKKIAFNIPENYICQDYCGVRGSLSGAEFPLSSKKKYSLKTENDLACISSIEEPCPWDQSQKEPK